MPFFAKPIAKAISQKVKKQFIDPNLQRIVQHMEAGLAQTGWFAGGELSAADIQMSFPVEAAVARAGADLPNLKSFLERIHARPAYKLALEKGGEFALLS